MAVWRSAIRELTRHPARTGYSVVVLGLAFAAISTAMSARAGVAELTPWRYAGATFQAEVRGRGAFTGITYQQLKSAARALHGRIVLAALARKIVLLSGGRWPESVTACYVSKSFFRLLGIPATGLEGYHARGAIISASVWRTDFESDPKVLGKALFIDHAEYHVAGVIADEEAYPQGVGVYIPLSSSRTLTGAQVPLLTLLARPRGRMEEGAAAKALDLALGLAGQGRGVVTMESIAALVGGSANRSLKLILFAVGLLLLAAWFNVSVVLLLGAQDRARDIAIRQLLGIGQRRLLAGFLAEGLLTCAAAAVLGWCLAEALGGVRLAGLSAVASGLPGVLAVAGAAAACSVLLALVFAYSYPPERALWRALAADAGTRARTAKLWRVIAAAEGAIAVVLVAGACMFVVSLIRVARAAPGFRAKGLLAVVVDDTAAPARRPLRREVEARLARFPGVRSVALAAFPPLSGPEFTYSVTVAPARGPARGIGSVAVNAVGPGYFGTLGVRMLQGRGFGRAPAKADCVVNQEFASLYLGGRPLRAQLLVGAGPPCSVVGVSADFRAESVLRAPQPMIFLPLAHGLRGRFALVLRAAPGSGPSSHSIRAAISALAPIVPRARVISVEGRVSGQISRQRRWALTASLVAIYCLVIASVGLFAMADATGRRSRHDIGVRMALGASPGLVIGEVAGRFLRSLLLGVVVGFLAALGVEKRLAPLLFGTAGAGPLLATYAAAGVLACGAALLWAGARRSCALEPAEALRLGSGPGQ